MDDRPTPTHHEPTEGFPAPTLEGGPGRSFQRFDRVDPSPYPLSEYARRFAWALAYALLFRPTPNRMYAWRRWLLQRFGARMGHQSKVRPRAVIRHPWLLAMGDYATLDNNVEIYNLGPVAIGAHTCLSQDSYVCAGTHDHTRPSFPLLRPPVTIGDGVWIAAGAFIGPGVRVGDNAIVAARAVVMTDVPARAIARGNPATPVRERPIDD
ncbi:MAG: putative colanic acid biosynthesis acetyltransferase [Planctomycetota bacterium]